MVNNIHIIESIGHLLAYYRSDLQHMMDFQNAVHSENKNICSEYIHNKGRFATFLYEYRIVRNIEAGKIEYLFYFVRDFIKSNQSTNVDILAEQLKSEGITHGKMVISLASKILFLNQPEIILPYDKFAKMSIGYQGKSYFDFLSLVNNRREFFTELFGSLPSNIHDYLNYLELPFSLKNIELIRINRFTDKILWTLGKSETKLESIQLV